MLAGGQPQRREGLRRFEAFKVGGAEQSEVDCSGRHLQMTIMLRLV